MNVRMFVTEFWYTGEVDYRKTIQMSKDFIDKKFANVFSLLSHSV
jgi:hypothetical protein